MCVFVLVCHQNHSEWFTQYTNIYPLTKTLDPSLISYNLAPLNCPGSFLLSTSLNISLSGEEGVYNVLKLLNEELILAMKLAGCVSLTDLKPSLIRTALSFQSRL